jgi:hypothetical protein
MHYNFQNAAPAPGKNLDVAPAALALTTIFKQTKLNIKIGAIVSSDFL